MGLRILKKLKVLLRKDNWRLSEKCINRDNTESRVGLGNHCNNLLDYTIMKVGIQRSMVIFYLYEQWNQFLHWKWGLPRFK